MEEIMLQEPDPEDRFLAMEQYDEDPEEHSLRLVTEEIERSFANKKPSTPLQIKAAKVIADLLFL